ncbi:MAG: TonB-dependent receptor [Acidobacteria bacterium]|nr:TonB-dependent receptor [Acidobacteriota bacterium]
MAQAPTGDIVGRVVDSSGAVLPGVAVSASGGALLQPMSAVTGDTGTYLFPGLQPGLYTVRFELTGFRTVIVERVQVNVGASTTTNITLEVSALEESVTVTSEAPLVDTRKAGTKTNFTQEQLQNVPSARDPWVMLERTPGITMDRTNVGGSQSGQQSGYISRGATTTNNKWLLDGVDITDQAATGASAVYYDFDMLEELQISTGGNDVTQQTGGVGINLVTKSGSDQFRGSGRYYVTDDKFGSVNLTDDLRKQGARSGAPVQSIKDYGIEGGGPIWRSRAWFWGSYSKQDVNVGVVNFFKKVSGCPVNAADPLANSMSVADLNACLNPDTTTLDNYNIKGSALLFSGNTFTWHSNFADKVRNARDASDTRPIETTYIQEGPVWTHKASDRHVFSDRWIAEAAWAHVGGGFGLLFNQPGNIDVQPLQEITTGRYERSYNQSEFNRPATSIQLTSTYFKPAMWGGDHAFKVGYVFRDTPSESGTVYGGDVFVFERNGVAERAQFYRSSSTAYDMTTHSAFISDTFTKGKLTLSAGIRWDRQDDSARASSVPANRLIPQWLPGVTFDGADGGIVFSNWSPRLNAGYDIFGTGRTVARSSFSVYYGQIAPGSLSAILNPLTAASITFPWTDLNRDRVVSVNEIDQTRILAFSGNYNPNNPSALGTPNSVDTNTRNDKTVEWTATIDHQLGRRMAVSLSYIYRHYSDFRFDKRVGITAADWTEATFTPNCPVSGTTCSPLRYYQPNFQIPAAQRTMNRDGYTRSFNGIEAVFTKRMANRWMFDGSYAFNSAVDKFASIEGYSTTSDPTNYAIYNGGQYAPEAGGSGIDNVFPNAKHLVKLSGVYTAPWDINVGAFYNARQGYIYPRRVLTLPRINAAGTVNLYYDTWGDTRYDTLQTIDLRVSKRFVFGRRSVEGSMDVFNVGNVNTVLTRSLNQTSANANFVTGIVAPRILRFGVRVVF